MKKEDISEIKEQIEKNKLDSFAAFQLGLDLQKNGDFELIESIKKCFENRNNLLDKRRKRTNLLMNIQDGTLQFIKTLFRLSGSKFEISSSNYSPDSIYEGTTDFKRIVGIKKFSTSDHTEYSLNINIEFDTSGLAYLIFKALFYRVELTVSNDSGEDDINVGYESFDNVVFSIPPEDEGTLYKLKERLYYLNSVNFDDFSVLCEFIGHIDKIEKEWFEKSLLLSTISNDGGRQLLNSLLHK